MDQFVIEGGIPLEGSVAVSGSKNAALPLLFASILFDEPVTYENVPNLMDIRTTVNLLKILGCEVNFDTAAGKVISHATHLQPEAPYDMVKTMRASILCLGPLLTRLGEVKVAMPGGCAIGARPIDMHISALEKMGARFDLEHGYVHGRCEKLKGTRIHLDFPTVTGTSNVIMAATLAEGETILENAAREPEIVDVCRFLQKSGVQIEGAGESVIHIQGVTALHPISYAIMPDRIEAGTFMVAAGITGGKLLLKNCPADALTAVIDKLQEMGMTIEIKEDGVLCSSDVSAGIKGADVTTWPFPGFPTDMQPQIMALASVADGSSIITETIFENRFMHVPELVRMGADIRLAGHAVVRGVRRLAGAPVMASDLRAGAALVLAGLAASGTTTVDRVYHIDRGYDRFEEKLKAVGARIQRVNVPQ